MNVILKYRGRHITEHDVTFLRKLIADHPELNRKALSRKVCEAWDWRQPNGYLKDGICRSLMLELHRAGHIELPPPRTRSGGSTHRKPKPTVIDTRPIQCALAELQPLTFRHVRRTPEEPMFNSLLEQYHELGYTQPVGEQLKFLVYGAGRVVGALSWSSAAHGLTCRDQFIGWSAEKRRKNRHLLAYNSRFLVPPWVRVPHLASHILGRMARLLSGYWQEVYSHPIYFVETFVDPTRHRGSCYRAANWIVMGRTFGRGHRAPTDAVTRSVKWVLGYPLVKRFRELLTDGER